MYNNKELYDRRWKVTITDPKTGESRSWGRFGEDLYSNDLRIMFSTSEGEDSKHSNEMQLTISNLNKKSREFATRKGLEVTLEAGYKELFGLIFKGKTIDTGYSTHEHNRGLFQGMNRKDDTDWSTTLNVQDTFPNKKKTIISLALKPDTTLQTLFNKIAKELDLGEGKIKLPKDLKKVKYNNGLSLYGNAQDILNRLVKPLGLVYTIKNKALNIYSPSEGINNEVFVINADSGLSGSPDKTEKGYTFQTLLIPNMFKGQLLKLDSRDIKKDVIITKLRYRGDSDNNEWFNEIEAIEKK